MNHDDRRLSISEKTKPAPLEGYGLIRLLSLVSRVLLALGVFGLAFVPLRGSQDEWWHLKTGKWIWEHGYLPANDIFTYTGENLRWYNHEWLSQVLFFLSYHWAELAGGNGLISVITFKSVIVTLTFLLVARLACGRMIRAIPQPQCHCKILESWCWLPACAIALVAADISRRTIFPRPPVFSYLMLAVFLGVMYAWKHNHLRFRWLWLLVPLTILWGNLHGMVLLAFLVTGAYTGGEFFENCFTWWRTRKDKQNGGGLRNIFTREVQLLILLTISLVLAAMLQPSGYHLFFLGRNFTADPLLQRIILEMQPTPGPFMVINPDLPWWNSNNLIARPPGFWTFWVELALIFLLILRGRIRRITVTDGLLVAFFTWQGIMHWRLLPLFAIVTAGPLAAMMAPRISENGFRRPTLAGLVGFLPILILVGWFNFTVAEPPPNTFFRRNLALLRGKVFNYSDYPKLLMDYIIQADLPDRMFSDSNYCGYAIWRLSPEHHKLFTDTRFDLFGSQFIREERIVFYAAQKGDYLNGHKITEGWQEILQRYQVNFIVFRPVDRRHLFHALLKSDEWQMVYYFIAPEADPAQWPLEGYYVWVRNGPDTDDIARRSAAIFEQQFPGEPLPATVWNLVKSSRRPGTNTTDSQVSTSWKVPLE